MNVEFSYLGRSQLRHASDGQRILELAPDLARDKVAFDARLKEPIRFREAISALHDVVINDLTYQPRDKAAYEEWKRQQSLHENTIRRTAMEQARQTVAAGLAPQPTEELKLQHRRALNRYWKARSTLNVRLRQQNETLWRRLMTYDPVITVADDVIFFECFSSDESSYGCLTLDRDACFSGAQDAVAGTTNIDYSWQLYHHFQSLRTYRETRFRINPEGFSLLTSDRPEHRQEKIELPDGWLRGFMQLQTAMTLPMKKVTLGIDAVYSLLAWLKRHREKHGPRAIRFELENGKSPRMVLEPWNLVIESPATVHNGAAGGPIRIWGRRRLMSLARLLPLATHVDVYLPGTGLPSFWVVQMGNMRLTLGLSGWTANDWSRGSAVQLLLPATAPGRPQVAAAASLLAMRRAATLDELKRDLQCSASEAAAVMNQLTLRGQAIFDLNAGIFRWRQILPMALSDREFGSPHPELAAAEKIVASGKVKIETCQEAPRGGSIVTGKVENQSCEVLIDGDGIIRKGKCRCSWHFKSGVRNGPCRHLQALRESIRSFSK